MIVQFYITGEWKSGTNHPLFEVSLRMKPRTYHESPVQFAVLWLPMDIMLALSKSEGFEIVSKEEA